jgi:hypothetical protein
MENALFVGQNKQIGLYGIPRIPRAMRVSDMALFQKIMT